MGSPAGSSGTGTGSTANVYNPKSQPTADWNWSTLIQPLINDAADGGAGSPAAQAYAYSLPFTDTLARGWSSLPAGATGGDYLTTALTADQTGLDYANKSLFPQAQADSKSLSTFGNWALGEGSNLYGQAHDAFKAAPQILDMGYDPKNVQYNRDRGAALDAASVTNSMAGIGSSPYGSSVAADALINFDSDWTDKKLQRAEDAASSYGGLLKAGGGLTTEGGIMTGYGGSALTSAESLGAKGLTDTTAANRAPFSDLTSGASTITGAQSKVSDLGTAKYALPQSTINELASYMGLGQSASSISGTLGSMGQSQLGSSMSGIGSAVGTGSNLLFGSGGSGLLGSGGLGGLFGSGGAAAFDSGLALDAGLGSAGFGAELASAAPLMASSDRRLKTDIRRLGKLPNGLPVYTFRYRGKDQRHIGLMADEVEKVHPDAVVTGPDGYKMVDYAKATR